MKDINTRIYCCGGTGINLGSMITSPVIETCFIDASRSNRPAQLDQEKVHYIPGLEGSGSNPAQNFKVISDNIPEILEKFPPADFNIVLSSAGGGSGSVIGRIILRNLLQKKAATVIVLIGDGSSSTYLKNTINTLKSLELLSLNSDQPVVMSYHQNNQGVSRSDVNQEVLFAIEALGVMANQDNDELDVADVTNWQQYNKVTAVHPQLSCLNIHTSRRDAMTVAEPVSILSLWPSKDEMNAFGDAQYVTNGFPRNLDQMVAEQLHFIINIPGIEEINTALTDRQNELDRKQGKYRQRNTIVDVDDIPTDGDMIL